MAGVESSSDEQVLAASTFEAERRLNWTRLLVMATGTVILPFVARGSTPVVPWLAWTVLAGGWAYALTFAVFEPYRRYPLLLSPGVTVTVDTFVTLLWVFATGGVESPWSVSLFVVIVLVSLRHRPVHAFMSAALGASGYLLIALLLGQLPKHPANVGVHVLYMFFIASAVAVVVREQISRLSSRRRLLDLTQEVGQIGTWEWSVEKQTLSWSDELHRIFGVPCSFRPTLDLYLEMVHPDDRADTERRIGEALSTGSSFRFEHRIVTSGGALRWLHCRGRVTLGADGKPQELVGSAQDITDHKEMQAQVLLSAKLASLGTLASGVAHEINNPLAYVANNLDVLERQLDGVQNKLAPEELEALRAAVGAARHGAARMSDIVGGLKTFARADAPQRSVIDLARAADLAIEIASHEITHRARLVCDYSPTAPVSVNESRLSQVLVNLLVNAAHSIERGSVADNEIRVHIYPDKAGRSCVEVSDTGSGVAPDHVNRIFDPFFTTKPTGMGLGLSVCHRLLRDFGGEIELARTGAEGTTFRVSLPAADAGSVALPEKAAAGPCETSETSETSETERPRAAREAARAPRAATRKRLLVIDDEVRYADSLRLLLGYEHEVALATDADSALALLSSGATFDAILCDLMMPGKTGMDLYEDLVKSTPELCARFVFLTGGATTDRARDFLARPDIRYLEKPVELPTLEALIEVVASPAASLRA